MKLLVQFKDCVHCAIEQSREALFTFTNRGFRSEPLDFHARTCRENPKSRLEVRREFEGFSIQGRKVSEDRPIGLEQRNACVAYGVEGGQVRIIRKKVHDSLRIVYEASPL